ncbi:hypothetical protein WSM22_17570 [Cytophagales bacterium WSM2-2]|nr:hypothetical protein WSM22_17570 [Cytophagales bacterium WSM2-2]
MSFDPDQQVAEYNSKLAAGYKFMKSNSEHVGNSTKDKVEYSYAFTKDTQYIINLCASEPVHDGIVVTMLDSKRNEIISSKIERQFSGTISYICKTTGIYYIQYDFNGSSRKCAGDFVAFKQ